MNRDKIEGWSVTPLYIIGYGRVILFFILNCLLLYSVAQALAELNSISTEKVYGSLILGSLFGISYPIILSRTSKTSDNETKLLKLAIIAGILIIQGFVLIDTLILYSDTNQVTGDLKYAIFNIIVGIIADFAVGSEFSSHVKRGEIAVQKAKEAKEAKTKEEKKEESKDKKKDPKYVRDPRDAKKNQSQ